MKKSIDAVLACRNGGSRLYGKPLQPLAIGKVTVLDSLLQYVKAIRSIKNIVLAIAEGDENKIFIEVANKYGLSYVIGDEQDVVGRIIKGAELTQADYIFNTSTECPFVLYEYVDQVIEECVAGKYDRAAVEEAPEGAGFQILKTEALKISHEKGEDKHRAEIVALYIFEHLNEFKLLNKQLPPKLRRMEVRLTVDYAEDLVFCQKVYQTLKKEDQLIRVEEIIEFWDQNPDLRKPLEEIGIDWGHGRLWE